MKKYIFTLIIIPFLFSGCDILDDEIDKQRSVHFFVQNSVSGNPTGAGSKTSISYYDVDGNTLFKDIEAGYFWTAVNNDFTKGDRVFLGITSPYRSGIVTLRMRCDKCEDFGGSGGNELVKTIDLSVTTVGNISANLN